MPRLLTRLHDPLVIRVDHEWGYRNSNLNLVRLYKLPYYLQWAVIPQGA